MNEEELKDDFRIDILKKIISILEEDKDIKNELVTKSYIDYLQEKINFYNIGVQKGKLEERNKIKEIIEELVSFTCECGCVTFDNKKCRLCGKSPKYGEIDYEQLQKEIDNQPQIRCRGLTNHYGEIVKSPESGDVQKQIGGVK